MSQWIVDIPPETALVWGQPVACPGACTRRLKAPVTLIASFIHMHALGKGAAVRRWRNGTELPPLAQLKAFDYGYQSWTPIPAGAEALYPGERVELTCTYDSRGRAKRTTFGWDTADEMCVLWLLYWPAEPGISFCASVGTAGMASCSADAAPLFAALDRNVSRIVGALARKTLISDDDPERRGQYVKYAPPKCAASAGGSAAKGATKPAKAAVATEAAPRAGR